MSQIDGATSGQRRTGCADQISDDGVADALSALSIGVGHGQLDQRGDLDRNFLHGQCFGTARVGRQNRDWIVGAEVDAAAAGQVHGCQDRRVRIGRADAGMGLDVSLHQRGQRRDHGGAGRRLQGHRVGDAGVDIEAAQGNEGAAQAIRPEEVAIGIGDNAGQDFTGFGLAVAIGIEVELRASDVAVGNFARQD